MNPTRSHQIVAALLAALSSSLFSCETNVAGPTGQTAEAVGDTIVARGAGRILVDASHDGGVWWYPQNGTFSQNEHHQGQGLADYLRSLGFEVDELARGTVLTADLLEPFPWIVRAGKFGAYRASELDAYEEFLSQGRTLILLGEYLRSGQHDELAESLGLTLAGTITTTVTRFEQHELTEGVLELSYIAGSAIVEPMHNVQPLAWTDDGDAVMGIVEHPRSRIFFLGDVNGIELLPQPLVDNLIAWGFRTP